MERILVNFRGIVVQLYFRPQKKGNKYLMRRALKNKSKMQINIVKCISLGGTEDKILLGFSIMRSRELLSPFIVLEY